MRSVEIQIVCAPHVLNDLFGSDTVPKGTTNEVPGKALLELTGMRDRARGHIAHLVATVLLTWGPHALGLGKDIAVSLFANWLYNVLARNHIHNIRVNHQVIEVTREGLAKIFSETIEAKND
jgi:hypothetical protein